MSSILEQRLTQFFAGDLFEVCIDSVQVAVVVQQRASGFGTDTWDTGNVVRAITRQREHVPYLLDTDAEAFAHLLWTDHLVAHGVPHQHVRSDELHQVLVGADDHGPPAALPGQAHHGGNHVVGLEAIELQARQGEGLHHLRHSLHLLLEIIRRSRAIGFVGRVTFFAKRGGAGVHGDGQQLGAALTQQALQHVDGAKYSLSGFTSGTAQRRNGMVGAKDVAAEVYQIEDVVTASVEELRNHGSGSRRCRQARQARESGRLQPRGR